MRRIAVETAEMRGDEPEPADVLEEDCDFAGTAQTPRVLPADVRSAVALHDEPEVRDLREDRPELVVGEREVLVVAMELDALQARLEYQVQMPVEIRISRMQRREGNDHLRRIFTAGLVINALSYVVSAYIIPFDITWPILAFDVLMATYLLWMWLGTQLKQYILDNPDFIRPERYRNEALAMLEGGVLEDLCISRPKSRLTWGIELPFDTDYVSYVWFDALANYITALGWPGNEADAEGTFGRYWPGEHLVAKDILKPHGIFWPTMLMALDIPLPKHILAHGWWLVNGGEKMSKSAGNVVKPMDYMEKYGDDAFRYYLAREMVVGQDANFTHDSFVRRINADLANDLGNVLNRVHKLVLTNFEGKLPAAVVMDDAANDVMNLAKKVIEDIKQDLPQARLSQSIENIMSLVRSINRYFEIKAPWKLAKDPALKDELATVLYVAAEAVRLSLCMLWPVIPTKAEEGLAMLGTKFTSAEDLVWGLMKGGEAFGEGKPLFPRIDEEVKPQQQQQQAKPKQNKPLTAADVPAAMDLRAAKIVEVADHPDADSLYVLKVDAGEGELRTVCSGLKASYQASELQDRMILLFANLKPAPLRGIMSAGMLFAGDLEPETHKCRLVAVPEGAKPGDRALFKGIEPSEPRELKLKDFDKIALSVKNGEVFCTAGEGTAPIALEIGGKAVTCDVADGNGVH